MFFTYPLNKFYITSLFGWRNSPYPDEQGIQNYHNGIDLRAAVGDPVYSIAKGTVKNAYWTDKGGNQVVIEHPNGYRSGYAHLDSIDVNAGDPVKAGQEIGKAGKTGGFVGMASHLHFTVKKDNEYINPADLNYQKFRLLPLLLLIALSTGLYFSYK